MWLKASFLFFVGGIFFLFGLVFTVPTVQFIMASEPATLVVVRVDEEWFTDHMSYKPVFGLHTDAGPQSEYAGMVWSGEKLHAEGDIVEGRHDPETGKMQSNALSYDNLVVGLFLLFVGLFVMLLPITAPRFVSRMRWSSSRTRVHRW